MSHILNFHLPYIESLRAQGYSVDIAAENACAHPLTDNFYDLEFVKNPLSLQNLKTVSCLRDLMLRNHYDIVISNSTLSGAASRTAAKMLGSDRPRCVHISHGYMFDNKNSIRSQIYRTAERFCAGVTDTLVVMNREDLILSLRFRLGKKIFFTNGMGLDISKYPLISDDEIRNFRKKLGANDNTIIFLCAGELSDRKNQRLLIEAFDIVTRKFPDTLLLLAGTGDKLGELRLLVQKLELNRKVRFLGHRNDMNTIYRSSDALLSASKMEGLPFNVMESLYCGTPVIVSDIKGHKDLIKNGSNGLLFSIEDQDPLSASKAMAKILEDPLVLSGLKQRTFLEKKYYLENVRPELLSVITGHRPSAEINSPEGAFK